MTRPPLIRTDIADLPSRSLALLAALGQADDGFLPILAVDVNALFPQRRDGLLREVGAVGGVRRRLADHLELVRDVRGVLERRRVNHAHAELVRPDERVDLVHLPRLVTLPERGSVREHHLDTGPEVVAAVHPALE